MKKKKLLPKIKDMDEKDVEGRHPKWLKERRAMENELEMIYEAKGGRVGVVKWKLEKSGFTLQMHISISIFQRCKQWETKKLWKNKVPLKLKALMCLAFQNRLQTGSSERKKKKLGGG